MLCGGAQGAAQTGRTTMLRGIMRTAGVGTLVWLLCASRSSAAETEKGAAPELTPEQTVTRYLEALKAGNFPACYDYISKGMTDGKSRDAWSKEQQWTMQMSDAKIFDYHVYPGKVDGDKAHVPNILSSQDKFLNQLGVPEHELYTLIREDGRWKIDQQQLLEKADQAKWFPNQAPEK
jgi:hypothetical protein